MDDEEIWKFSFPFYVFGMTSDFSGAAPSFAEFINAHNQWLTPEINGEKHLALFTSTQSYRRFASTHAETEFRLVPLSLEQPEVVRLLHGLAGRVEWVCIDSTGQAGSAVMRMPLAELLAICEEAEPGQAWSLTLEQRLRWRPQ